MNLNSAHTSGLDSTCIYFKDNLDRMPMDVNYKLIESLNQIRFEHGSGFWIIKDIRKTLKHSIWKSQLQYQLTKL